MHRLSRQSGNGRPAAEIPAPSRARMQVRRVVAMLVALLLLPIGSVLTAPLAAASPAEPQVGTVAFWWAAGQYEVEYEINVADACSVLPAPCVFQLQINGFQGATQVVENRTIDPANGYVHIKKSGAVTVTTSTSPFTGKPTLSVGGVIKGGDQYFNSIGSPAYAVENFLIGGEFLDSRILEGLTPTLTAERNPCERIQTTWYEAPLTFSFHPQVSDQYYACDQAYRAARAGVATGADLLAPRRLYDLVTNIRHAVGPRLFNGFMSDYQRSNWARAPLEPPIAPLRAPVRVAPPLAPITEPLQGPPVYHDETAGGGNPSQHTDCSHRCVADPVNTASGAFTEEFSDLAVPGRGPALNLTRSYDSSRSKVEGPLGFGWTHAYDMRLVPDAAAGRVSLLAAPAVNVVQENGSRVAFIRHTKYSSGGDDIFGSPAAITADSIAASEPAADGAYDAPTRVLAALHRNIDGTFTFTRKKTATFTFDAAGKLIAQTDRNGYTTTLAYDAEGRLATVTDPAGRQLTFSSTGGRITSVSDPIGRKVGYTYDAAGNLTTSTNVAGHTMSFSYDGSHRIVTMTNPRGGVTTNTYDALGRVTKQVDPAGGVTSFAYTVLDATNTGTYTVTMTDPRGIATTYEYENNQVMRETKSAGTTAAATVSYTYDPLTRAVATVTNPRGLVTRFSYDAAGNQLTVTDPLARVTTSTYDANGNVTSSTDPSGIKTTMTYDARGNLLTTSTPIPGSTWVQTTTLTHDAARPGDVVSTKEPTGKVSTAAYDAAGNLVKTTNPMGHATTMTYDASGRMLTAKSPKLRTTTYTYNAYNQVLTTTDALGNKVTNAYDAHANLVSVTDQNAKVTTTAYDALDRPVTVTRPDGVILRTAYNATGQRIGSTNGAGKKTSYAIDAQGRVASVTDPLLRKTSYSYDKANNLVRRTAANGVVATYTYDSGNQLTSISYSDGTPKVTYTYDKLGRRRSMVDGTGTSTWTYDALGRLTASKDGAAATTSYSWDIGNRLTKITYPGGKAVSRSYDSAGRWIRVTDWLGKVTRSATTPTVRRPGRSSRTGSPPPRATTARRG